MQVTSFGLPRLVQTARVDTHEIARSPHLSDAGNAVSNTELTEEDVRRIGRRAGEQLRALIRRARHAG